MNFKLGNSFFLRYKIIQNNQSRPSLLYMTEIILAAAACQGSVTELRRLGTLSCPDQDIQVEPEFTYESQFRLSVPAAMQLVCEAVGSVLELPPHPVQKQTHTITPANAHALCMLGASNIQQPCCSSANHRRSCSRLPLQHSPASAFSDARSLPARVDPTAPERCVFVQLVTGEIVSFQSS